MAKWTEEEHDYLMQLYSEADSPEYSKWADDMTQRFGRNFTYYSLRNRIRRSLNIKSQLDSDKETLEHKETLQIKSDGSQVSQIKIKMTKQQSKSPAYVLEAHGYSSKEWKIKQAVNNLWEQNSNERGLVQLYQSKITVEPLGNEISAEKLLQLLKENIKPITFSVSKRGSRNLVIPLADIHSGIMKFKGLEPFLLEIIEIISKGYDTIVIEQVGDLFHSSQFNSSQTVKGTLIEQVDMEQAVGDMKRFFDVLISEALRHSNKVMVKHAQGNHSANLEYMFLVYLEAKYPDVEVDYHIQYRTAYMIENVGILLAHGDTAKNKLPMLFATEYPDIWAKATYRESHTGHFHKKVAEDESGVVTRQLGTPKKPDNWEKMNGYTMAYHTMQIFEYDENKLKVTYDIG